MQGGWLKTWEVKKTVGRLDPLRSCGTWREKGPRIFWLQRSCFFGGWKSGKTCCCFHWAKNFVSNNGPLWLCVCWINWCAVGKLKRVKWLLKEGKSISQSETPYGDCWHAIGGTKRFSQSFRGVWHILHPFYAVYRHYQRHKNRNSTLNFRESAERCRAKSSKICWIYTAVSPSRFVDIVLAVGNRPQNKVFASSWWKERLFKKKVSASMAAETKKFFNFQII